MKKIIFITLIIIIIPFFTVVTFTNNNIDFFISFTPIVDSLFNKAQTAYTLQSRLHFGSRGNMR